MSIWLSDHWKDYEVLNAGGGEKLERWGQYVLLRPDPQAIWPMEFGDVPRVKVHAHYHRSASGGGHWETLHRLPEQWRVRYKGLTFIVRPTGFKHTGLFPEQAVNWDFMAHKIRGAKRQARILNLFAYTGGATLACAQAGAHEVVHVDAAKGMVAWAKDNLTESGLQDKPVRFIVDDCFKFVLREQRRGRAYHGIVMDPPSYGRGPDKEMWKLEEKLFDLVEACMPILADAPLFFIINSYTTGLSPVVLENILKLTVGARHKGRIEARHIGLPVKENGLVLPCGAAGRWEAE
ncbi:MAG: class I SAM-dependent methyltransferase [Bacillota bacterium]